jgi:hypothetical protein
MNLVRFQLEVKFRAMGVTFGSVKKQWQFELSVQGVRWHEVPFEPNDRAYTLNERGVKVKIW